MEIDEKTILSLIELFSSSGLHVALVIVVLGFIAWVYPKFIKERLTFIIFSGFAFGVLGLAYMVRL